jgi:hypothetical protein
LAGAPSSVRVIILSAVRILHLAALHARSMSSLHGAAHARVHRRCRIPSARWRGVSLRVRTSPYLRSRAVLSNDDLVTDLDLHGLDAEDDMPARPSRYRQLNAGILHVLGIAAIVALDLSSKPRSTHSPNRRDRVFDFGAFMTGYTDAEFYASFRLTGDAFNVLFEAVQPKLPSIDMCQAKRSAGHWITAEQRVLAYLRYVGGGDVKDIKRVLHPISRTEVGNSIWLVCDIINEHFAGACAFPMPSDTDTEAEKAIKIAQLRRLELGFRKTSRGQCWMGQVSALDGTLIGMTNPGRSIRNAAEHFCARKSMFAMLLMAMCDVDRKFTWWDMSHTARTHDSKAFKGTPLGVRLAAGCLPRPFFTSGDAAFEASNSLVCPGGGDAYNYQQSSSRMPIECAFGMLSMTFGVLWRKLNVRFNRRAPLISSLLHVHNFRIDHKLTISGSSYSKRKVKGKAGTVEQWEVLPGIWKVPPSFDKHGRLVEPVDSNEVDATPALSGSTKARLIKAVKDAGVKRPSPSRIGR